MSRQQQQIPTPFGLVIVDLLKCDQCGQMVTEPSALGWLQVVNLGALLETFDSDDDLSGDYCGAECLMKMMIDEGISAACGETPPPLAGIDLGGVL